MYCMENIYLTNKIVSYIRRFNNAKLYIIYLNELGKQSVIYNWHLHLIVITEKRLSHQ